MLTDKSFFFIVIVTAANTININNITNRLPESA